MHMTPALSAFLIVSFLGTVIAWILFWANRRKDVDFKDGIVEETVFSHDHSGPELVHRRRELISYLESEGETRQYDKYHLRQLSASDGMYLCL